MSLSLKLEGHLAASNWASIPLYKIPCGLFDFQVILEYFQS